MSIINDALKKVEDSRQTSDKKICKKEVRDRFVGFSDAVEREQTASIEKKSFSGLLKRFRKLSLLMVSVGILAVLSFYVFSSDNVDAVSVQSVSQQYICTGIVFEYGSPAAIINDHIVGVGEKIGNARVQKIFREKVSLLVDGASHVIRIS